MQSTAIANGTRPQLPHCHTPCTPAAPSSTHATFPSQSEKLLFHPSTSTSFSFQSLTSGTHNLTQPHTPLSAFIIDNFGFSCISFLHPSLTFLQAMLSNIPLTSASDNSLNTLLYSACSINAHNGVWLSCGQCICNCCVYLLPTSAL